MKKFVFQTAKSIMVEFGAARRLGEIVSPLGMKRALVVTDPGIAKAGLLERAAEGLKTAGVEVFPYQDVVSDPTESNIAEALAVARDQKVDGVVGLGGGSSMDVAKVVAFLANSSQTLEEIYGWQKARGPRLPLVQLPTTAGTGSEVTLVSVISAGEHRKKGVVGSQLLPDIAVLDAELTIGLPPHVTAATGVDAIVHAIEGYTAKRLKNPISDALARESMRLLMENIRTATHEGSNQDARENMLIGAMFAGQSFGNSMTAAVHAFAHVLGGHFHVHHGLANSLVLPHVMRFNLPDSARDYAELAAAALPDGGTGSDEERAIRLIEAIEELIEDLNLETRLRQVGIKEENLEDLAKATMKETAILPFNPREVTYDDALAIYRQAF